MKKIVVAIGVALITVGLIVGTVLTVRGMTLVAGKPIVREHSIVVSQRNSDALWSQYVRIYPEESGQGGTELYRLLLAANIACMSLDDGASFADIQESLTQHQPKVFADAVINYCVGLPQGTSH